jgi:hypothetical protein
MLSVNLLSGYKECRKCGEIKPRNRLFFHKETQTPDGLAKWCVRCKANYKPRYTVENRSRINELERIRGKERRWKDPAAVLIKRSQTLARQNKREFNLDKQWVQERLSECVATGMSFDLSRPINHRRSAFFPSIDRIDSKLGYTKDNCRVVCTIFNFAKNEWTDADVMKMAKALVNKELADCENFHITDLLKPSGEKYYV